MITFKEFLAHAKDYNVIPLCREIVLDRLTPVSVYERLAVGHAHSFLLESVDGGERFGRYSIVGRAPAALFTCKGSEVTYQPTGGKRQAWTTTNPLQDLKMIFAGLKPAPVSGLPRFWGGAVGYWSYDTVRFFERLPKGRKDKLGFPTGSFQLTGEVVVFDRLSQTAQVISTVIIPEGKRTAKDLIRLYANGVKALDRQIREIHAAGKTVPTKQKSYGTAAAPKLLTTRQSYLAGVEKAKEHIRAGDIIQVVLSQRWELKPKVKPFQIYRALRLVNPSPYMYYLRTPELEVVGSSPEILVRKTGNVAETRPIAGTRPRSGNEVEDARRAEDLLQDPKERAEHLMLVDLGRNDLGRVSEPGTVRVPELMSVEHYSHVMHLVSSVKSQLSPDANAFDLFQACFPAGTVSGAPKIRAMEIIDDLEPLNRGLYAGAVGYFSYDGNMDMAITIRTLVFKDGKGYMQAGAGIVADSVPETEYQESLHKAEALFAAVRKAHELL
jgi:anthranilate synthase component 1